MLINQVITQRDKDFISHKLVSLTAKRFRALVAIIDPSRGLSGRNLW